MGFLENEFLELRTTDKAGEMLSLIDKRNGRQILYQGDQGWSGHNPTLFPIIGSTWNNGEYEIEGKKYRMKNHGIIRYATLEEEQTDDFIRYTLDSDDSTRSLYPYDFHFEMTYRLNEDKVLVSYRITNTSREEMPFSFGLHPAFRTSQNPEEKFEDFSLQATPAGECIQLITDSDGTPVKKEKVLLDRWNLSRADLKKYATLIFEGQKAEDVILAYKDEPRVKMHFENYPYLAYWSHPKESDFICIEPWHGHSDLEVLDVPFRDREGTMILPVDETFEAGYEIEAIA